MSIEVKSTPGWAKKSKFKSTGLWAVLAPVILT